MSLNIDDFNQILYVNCNSGSDVGDGSENAPCQSITGVLSKVTGDNVLIYLDKGEYELYQLNDLSIANKEITVVGKDKDTTLVIKCCPVASQYKGNVNFYNMILQPSNNFSGDTRALAYTNDNYEVNFRNCLFTKSKNNSFPTSAFMYAHNSSVIYTNKQCYNCSFKGNLNVCEYGSIKLYNCCTDNSIFGNSSCNIITDCITGVSYDDKYKIKNNNSLYGVYSGDSRWEILKMLLYYDSKYHTYDASSNSIVDFTDDVSTEFNNNNNDSFITDLNQVKDLIDLKADNIKVISNKNFKSKIKSIKTTKQLFLANGDFSTRVANNIDYFKFSYNIPDGTIIKTVVSINSGNTWYTCIDGAWTQLDNMIPIKDYSELSGEEKIQWNTFLDEVLAKGINIQEVNTLDFNTLNSEKIRFAYAIQISDANANVEAILKDLKWQFDSIGSYEQMSPKTDVNIKITNNEISIQPLKDVELMKINVGISSQVPQVFDTSGLLDKETFKGKEINSVKLSDKARSLEPNLSQIDGTRKYYGVDNNDGEMKLRTFPAGTHTEHVDTYIFDNLTKDVPQTIPFIKERPEVNVMPMVFKYREGLKNQESILEKYSNDNITIKKNTIECIEEGLGIKDKWYMTSKQENDLYKTDQIDEFSNLKDLSYNTGYKYLVNSSPIGFRCNLSSNNFAIQYNIFVTGNEIDKPIGGNLESGGVKLNLFYDDVKKVMVKNKFNNVCHAVINNNLYIIVNGKDVINIGPYSISGGNTYLFYFGADPKGKTESSPPDKYDNSDIYMQNFYIYKFAYFTGITSLDDFKEVLDANMNYNKDTKFINLYYDFHSSSDFVSPTVGSVNIQYHEKSQISTKENKFIIEMDGKYYSAKKDNYDADTKKYREITFSTHDEFYNYAVDLSILNTNITINDETFKPIDKFTNYKLISDEDFKMILNAIKSDKEMIISRQNLSLLSAEKINAFKQIISKENNGNCKTVFSLDNGATWKSYDVSTSQFIDLTNTLPLDLVATTKPDDLSEENKTKWDNLQDEIIEKGIDTDTMQTLDFATLLGSTYKNIRFAHVLIRPTYDDKVTLQNMSWNIDEEGDYVQTNDVEIAVNSNRLIATSTK